MKKKLLVLLTGFVMLVNSLTCMEWKELVPGKPIEYQDFMNLIGNENNVKYDSLNMGNRIFFIYYGNISNEEYINPPVNSDLHRVLIASGVKTNSGLKLADLYCADIEQLNKIPPVTHGLYIPFSDAEGKNWLLYTTNYDARFCVKETGELKVKKGFVEMTERASLGRPALFFIDENTDFLWIYNPILDKLENTDLKYTNPVFFFHPDDKDKANKDIYICNVNQEKGVPEDASIYKLTIFTQDNVTDMKYSSKKWAGILKNAEK